MHTPTYTGERTELQKLDGKFRRAVAIACGLVSSSVIIMMMLAAA